MPLPATSESPSSPHLAPPKEHLDPRARTMWYVDGAIQFVFWTAIIVAAGWALIRFTPITDWWVYLAVGAIVVVSLIESIVTPAWRYRFWRYEIRDDEVDLQHGWVVQKRQVIPMSRIQHVDTRRGPLQRRFGLASVVFFTAAGSMEIPALSQDVAASVRDRIADLAKVHDDL